MDGYEDEKNEKDEEKVLVCKKGVDENEDNEVDIDSAEQNPSSPTNVVNSELKGIKSNQSGGLKEMGNSDLKKHGE